MLIYTLFVSPGIGPTDAAAARVRFEGEDEPDIHLDQERVRTVTAELRRELGLSVASEDDEEPGSVRGVDLEDIGEEDAAGGAGAPAPDNPASVRVDGWGVTISVFAGDTEPATAANVKRGLAIARAASRLLAGSVYDPGRNELIDPSDANIELVNAVTSALSERPAPRVDPAFKRARLAIIILVLIPTVGLNLARRYLQGFPLFLTIFAAMVAAAVFASWWVKDAKRSSTPDGPDHGPRGAPTAAPPPGTAPPPFDNRPIKPG